MTIFDERGEPVRACETHSTAARGRYGAASRASSNQTEEKVVHASQGIPWACRPFSGRGLPCFWTLLVSVGVIMGGSVVLCREAMQAKGGLFGQSSALVVILHVPSSGGSSTCKALIQADLHVNPDPFDTCRDPRLEKAPLWFAPPKTSRAPDTNGRSCYERQNSPFRQVFIETFLDTNPRTRNPQFCRGTKYGVLTREPIARVTSHVNHYLNLVTGAEGDNFKVEGGEELARWLSTKNAAHVTGFLDLLDATAPGTLQSAALIAKEFGHHTAKLEDMLWRINGFTSNYMARMLLGGALGDNPLFGPSKIITHDKVELAHAVMQRFDFVLRQEDAGTKAADKILSSVFAAKLPALARSSASDEVDSVTVSAFTRLDDPQFEAWLAHRNALDVELYYSRSSGHRRGVAMRTLFHS